MVTDVFRPGPSTPLNSASNGTASNGRELFELLNGLSGESGQQIAPELFLEKLDRLGWLLASHVDSEEQHSHASRLAVPCNHSHVQEHSLMLEQYVQWQFELMKMNASPRAEICTKIEEWLACHAFAPGAADPDAEAGPEN